MLNPCFRMNDPSKTFNHNKQQQQQQKVDKTPCCCFNVAFCCLRASRECLPDANFSRSADRAASWWANWSANTWLLNECFWRIKHTHTHIHTYIHHQQPVGMCFVKQSYTHTHNRTEEKKKEKKRQRNNNKNSSAQRQPTPLNQPQTKDSRKYTRTHSVCVCVGFQWLCTCLGPHMTVFLWYGSESWQLWLLFSVTCGFHHYVPRFSHSTSVWRNAKRSKDKKKKRKRGFEPATYEEEKTDGKNEREKRRKGGVECLCTWFSIFNCSKSINANPLSASVSFCPACLSSFFKVLRKYKFLVRASSTSVSSASSRASNVKIRWRFEFNPNFAEESLFAQQKPTNHIRRRQDTTWSHTHKNSHIFKTTTTTTTTNTKTNTKEQTSTSNMIMITATMNSRSFSNQQKKTTRSAKSASWYPWTFLITIAITITITCVNHVLPCLVLVD